MKLIFNLGYLFIAISWRNSGATPGAFPANFYASLDTEVQKLGVKPLDHGYSGALYVSASQIIQSITTIKMTRKNL